MERALVFSLLLSSSLLHFKFATGAGTADGSEEWGYVQVRPKAHMFWWLYRSPQRVDGGSTPWPTVLWLQGGPGGSGVAIGNFQEIGPLDSNLKPRNSTWLQKADLLFVDNPVGTGYSFVEDNSLVVKSDLEAAADLTTLLRALYNKNESMQKSPLFIVAESYGGKYAVTVGLSISRAVAAGELKLKLGGIALGDSWISPEDFVFSWGPLLLDVSRFDIHGADKSNSLALRIKQEIEKGEHAKATDSWSELEQFVLDSSNGVDFYNFLLDSGSDPVSLTADELVAKSSMKSYPKYLDFKASSSGSIDDLMNGIIKEKLGIIPRNVSWGAQSDLVFEAFAEDFMKPRISEVDELLSLGVNVTIYNGQKNLPFMAQHDASDFHCHLWMDLFEVDLICATKGVEAWVQKLKWEGLKKFTATERKPLYCGHEGTGTTGGFRKSYQNLHFYWILGAGHFVPADQPCVSLKMIADITQSPAADT